MTYENQLRVDISKDCCASGWMSAIGKDELRALRRYYFSLTGDEQGTYLMTHLQMVSNKSLDISISFKYYLLWHNNVVEWHSRSHFVLATGDYVECNNEF